MAYKLLSFHSPNLGPRAGVLIGDRIVDLGMALGTEARATTLDVLLDWESSELEIEALSNDPRADELPGQLLSQTRLLAPLLYPGQVFCAGANYRDHAEEMTRALGLPVEPEPHELGLKPWHFVKTGRSSIVGHMADVTLPSYSASVDWEAELAVVIGRTARNLSVAEALGYVAGYTIANDLSARDHVKRQHVADTSPFKYDWISQKCFEGSCPLGPWITPAAQIADPQALRIKLWVGNELMQDSSTSQMIFSVAEQIAHLSSRITLHPGDVILTGTPAGVGAARGRFLRDGETVRLWIEGIGELAHRVVGIPKFH